jgi:hypothetical protein
MTFSRTPGIAPEPGSMSELGQSRRFLRAHATSGYPPKLTVKADGRTGSLARKTVSCGDTGLEKLLNQQGELQVRRRSHLSCSDIASTTDQPGELSGLDAGASEQTLFWRFSSKWPMRGPSSHETTSATEGVGLCALYHTLHTGG